MKKIVCVEPGVIVEGTVLKSGDISKKDRKEVTKECVIATMQHLSCFQDFLDTGVAGYSWDKTDGSGEKIQLVLIDTGKSSIVSNVEGQ